MRFDRFGATASLDFLPLSADAAIPRGDKKDLPRLSSPCRGAPAFASGLSIAIEAAMVRARKRKNGD
ncbi:MAG: hypothetical protein KIS86_19200, partial [Devosia sp.]|nr:hypothetical protein [Devosia sp.]